MRPNHLLLLPALFLLTLLSPVRLIGQCNISNVILSNVQCFPFGFGQVGFQLNVQGSGPGNFFNVSSPDGLIIDPGPFDYPNGTFVNLEPTDINQTQFEIVVTDDADPSCSFTVTLQNPCIAQPPCSITFFFNGVIVCDDNGTPNDPSDDTFTTQVQVIGSGFGSSGWIGSDPLSSTGPYDQFVTIGPYLIADGPFNFSVQDVDDPNCETVQVQITPPAPCSTPVCDLDVIGGAVICNDGGTPGDLSDDTFFQNIVVSNGGNSGNWVSTSPDNDSGIFGISQTVGPFPSNSGQDLTFTITDANNPNCSTTYTIENPCPSQPSCNITDPGLNFSCNGNGIVLFSLNPTATGNGTSYTVSSSQGFLSSGIAQYGQTTSFLLQFSGAPPSVVVITITDQNDPSCSLTFTFDNPCFSSCDLTNPGLGFTVCNDNGTPTDPSDDFYTFPLNPVGSGLGSGYTVSVSGGTVSPPGGNYGSETTFTLTGIGPPAGISVIVTDNDDPNCFTNTIINLPPPCSTAPACDINYAQIGNVTCSDNGTPNDPNDDTFTFILQVVGDGTSPNGWTANDPLGTTGDYNVVTTMGPYPISGGGFPVVVTDNDDPSCTTISVTIVPPAPCSTPPPCQLTQSTVVTNQCVNDNPVFELLVDGNNTGANYTVSVTGGTISGSNNGNYGQITAFTIIPTSSNVSQFSVTVTDASDPSCTTTTVVPNPCPNCTITSAGLGGQDCNDSGTPSDPTDDLIQFTLNPSGQNTGGSYSVTASSGTVTPNTAAYGSAATFLTSPGTAGNGPITLTITDSNDPSCSIVVTLPDPGTCSNTTCAFTDPGVISVTCNDAGTPGNPGDDFVLLELFPIGVALSPIGYNLSSPDVTVTPGFGNLGVITAFQLLGAANAGPTITLILSDIDHPDCFLEFTIDNPAPCSVEPCNLNTPTVITPICDNGTIDFELLVNGTGTGTNYQVSAPGGVLTAGATGNYGQVTPFTLLPNNLSEDNFTLTITDSNDPTCSQTVSLDNPCDACLITAAAVSNVQCADNGTPGDPSDDLITFAILADGVSTAGSYTISAPGQTVQPSTGTFGSLSSFSLPPGSAGSGPVTLILTDASDSNCTTTVQLSDPGTCSDACAINAFVTETTCIPTGVPEDDFFQATIQIINPVGTTGWTAQTPLGPVTGNYNQDIDIGPFPISQGSFSLTITDQLNPGCSTTLLVVPPDPCSVVCEADTTIFELQSCNPLDTGTVVQNLTGQTGCDSIVITTTTLLPSDSTLLTQSSCNPADTGSVTQVLTNQFGCDSVVVLNTLLVDSDTTLIDLQSCNPLDTGTVVQNLAGQTGCDSTVITTTTLLPSDSTLLTQSSCNPADTGSVTQVLTNQFGCDSVVVINTLLVYSDTTLIDLQSCNPLDTGTLVQNLTGQTGCDSIVITTTTLLPSDSTLLTQSSCNPADTGSVTQVLTNQFGCDSVVVLNTLLVDSDTTLIDLQSCNPLDTGTVVQNLAGQTGCDSTVITTTTLLPSDSTLLTQSSCNPADTGSVTQVLTNQFGCDSVVVINTLLVYSDTTLIDLQSCNPLDTGTLVQNLTGQTGCDSIVITTTTLLPSDSTLLTQSSCNPADTGSVTQVLTNQFGCDSVVVLNTLLVDSDTTLIDLQSCNPLDTGTLVQNLTGQTGCDSTVITTTTLLPPDSTLLTQSSCNPADTGSVTQVLTNQFGCDSTVITTTALLPSDTTLLFSESCNPADTGTVTQVLTNQFGCDSTVITTTTLLPSDTTLLFSESCNPADTGTVTQVLTNQFGCDSTVITTTTLLPSDTTLLFSESCNPADTGTVSQVLTNQFGCDSTVITTTTLLPSDTTLLFGESCNPADTGTVSQVLTNQFGCDSTVITTTTLLPSDTTLLFGESCNPADTGTVSQVLTNQFGCDSTVITTTTLLPSDTTLLFGESCNPADTGTVIQNLINQFGCDSTIITTTTLLPGNTTVFFSQSCNPMDTGTVTQILTNQFGCDSIVTTQVLLFSDPDYQLVADTLCAGESLVINGTIYDQERPIGQEVIQSLAEGCDSVVIDIALVFAAPEAEISPTNPACEGLTGLIEIGPPENGFPPYTITAAGQLLEDVSAFPVTIDVLAGDYTVELTDALGCKVSQPVSITEGISPALSIDGPLILEQGDTLTLRPIINFEPETLEWRPAGQLSCSDCLNPVLEASESTILLLTASLGNGCSATANVQVLVERRVDIYAPNIFSPNGDGRNDRFTLFSAPGQIDQIERMEIYDRWGNQVFAQTEFPANNVAVGWDGTFRGEPMGPGVFTYYAQVRLLTGRIILQKGDVTLIR